MLRTISLISIVLLLIVGYVSPGQSDTLEQAQNGSLLVKVIPRGAEVIIKDRVVGNAPVLVTNIRPGRVWVEARLPGYRSWGKNVMVLETEKNVVTLILARSLR
ncbi:MAG: PEGA domain-containing protein [Magnetococcales bacterium]|nr:PEGA domain-containing protein [Magnetococcales bacterium]